MICIVPIGSDVGIKHTRLKGIVNQAHLNGSGIYYTVAYWDENDYHEISLYEHEFEYNGDKFELIK